MSGATTWPLKTTNTAHVEYESGYILLKEKEYKRFQLSINVYNII